MPMQMPYPRNAKTLTFFESVLEKFNEACKKSDDGVIDRFYCIGGYNVCLKFSGSALIEHITPSFEHLPGRVSKNPDLTICLWDSASTNTEIVPPPWSKQEFEHQGEIKDFNDERICTLFQAGEDTLNLLDFSRNLAIFWRRDNHKIPYYTTGAPLRSILHWWLSNNDRQFIHGAAVGKQEGGVLLVGKGGSGKSTAAISCLNSNLSYAGDDYGLVALEPKPYVYSLFNSAKLNFDHLERFPHLVPFLYNQHPSEEDKGLVILQRHLPEKLISGFPIKAILIPRVVANAKSRILSTTAATALAALAPSTMFQLTRNRAISFRRIAQLVKNVPAFILESGSDIQGISTEIEAFLEK